MDYHIAILNADTPMVEITSAYGDYADMVKSLLQSGSEYYSTEWNLVTKTYEVYKNPNDYPQKEDFPNINAIIITGSKASATSDAPWIKKLISFVKDVLFKYPHIKIVGLCFGHQIVAKAAGVPIIQNPKGWEVSSTVVQLTENGEKFFGRKVININQMHQDMAVDVPEGFELLGSTEDCEFQIFYKPRQALTFQGHPEFSTEVVNTMVKVLRGTEVFTEQQKEEALKRSENPADNDFLAVSIVKFLLE
ncbi:class I glutamine amidotransferase family protein, conserved in fungi, bacteria, plants [Schizosaccharomyces pombe]|uniref:Putative glutamine amidotransferase-like protein C13C5.04 n=1 Tax=Schizosaccharomyces pombe (strain 972 / ATCC 24843) TaxID=284812 RepID=YA14_SCHPO|nr:putative amidotransferase [Schizosaccharomyces pombe]Q09686.1 RecName: Full=Putative glutamine amidotransferase-like protein C13C5.04 [Schizosaccharomyces pombe 972h-]CAA90455.1 amidotransferase (predicted) [Schizosaccharomyces pombe]|eukprot:NP_592932.1 putative amidotransferase [Schizosaccharomyces pombe]